MISATQTKAQQKVDLAATLDYLSERLGSFTTTGTSTAFVGTPVPAVTSYFAGLSFWVTFHTAAGANPTLQISGLATPPNLVYKLGDGAYANINSNLPAGPYRVTLLSATQALVENAPSLISASGTIQVFTASGTYTKPAGVRRIKVRVVGGGGGGGQSSGANTSAGGGGGGGYSEKSIDATSITTVTVTVGAGGVNQGAGGASSFGAHCSATGGGAGANGSATAGAASGGSGGVGSGGDLNAVGGPGFPNAATTAGGSGGNSVLGGGGRVQNNQGTGTVGGNYGGGGGGGGDNAGVASGGTGAAGVVIVDAFY